MKAGSLLMKHLTAQELSQREFARKAGLSNPMPVTRMRKGAVIDEVNLRKIIKALPPNLRQKMRDAYTNDMRQKKLLSNKSGRRHGEVFAYQRVEKCYESSVDFSDIEVWTVRQNTTGMDINSSILPKLAHCYLEITKGADAKYAEESKQEFEELLRSKGKMIGEKLISGKLIITLSVRDRLLHIPNFQWQFYTLDSLAEECKIQCLASIGNTWTPVNVMEIPLLLRGSKITYQDLFAYCLHQLQQKQRSVAAWASKDENGDQVLVDTARLTHFLDDVKKLIGRVQQGETDLVENHNFFIMLNAQERELRTSMLEDRIRVQLLQSASSYFKALLSNSIV